MDDIVLNFFSTSIEYVRLIIMILSSIYVFFIIEINFDLIKK